MDLDSAAQTELWKPKDEVLDVWWATRKLADCLPRETVLFVCLE